MLKLIPHDGLRRFSVPSEGHKRAHHYFTVRNIYTAPFKIALLRKCNSPSSAKQNDDGTSKTSLCLPPRLARRVTEDGKLREEETETVSLRSCNLSLASVSFGRPKEMFDKFIA